VAAEGDPDTGVVDNNDAADDDDDEVSEDDICVDVDAIPCAPAI